MTARGRILALRLLEKQTKNPKLAKELGINVQMKKNTQNENNGGNINGKQ